MSTQKDISEKKKAHKPWNKMDGVYADLSNYPDSVEYYVKCPSCGQVRGGYKTAGEAFAERKCGGCSLEDISKIKKEIAKVIHQPTKKVKPLAAIVHEADETDLPPSGGDIPADSNPQYWSSEDNPESDDVFDEMANLSFSPNWVTKAVLELAEELSLDVGDDTIDTGFESGLKLSDVTQEKAEACQQFEIVFENASAYSDTYTVFRNEDRIYAYAKDVVTDMLADDISMFSASWVASHIEPSDLIDAIGDPYEDFGEDERNSSYEEKVELLTGERRPHVDHSDYYDEDGDLLPETPERVAEINSAIEDWIERNKPQLDPWEYLREIYGNRAEEEAVRLVRFSNKEYRELAEDALAADGWEHFVDDVIELPGGAYAKQM